MLQAVKCHKILCMSCWKVFCVWKSRLCWNILYKMSHTFHWTHWMRGLKILLMDEQKLKASHRNHFHWPMLVALESYHFQVAFYLCCCVVTNSQPFITFFPKSFTDVDICNITPTDNWSPNTRRTTTLGMFFDVAANPQAMHIQNCFSINVCIHCCTGGYASSKF